jgi:hypothetical protein
VHGFPRDHCRSPEPLHSLDFASKPWLEETISAYIVRGEKTHWKTINFLSKKEMDIGGRGTAILGY